MAESGIIIYTTKACPYCGMAKSYLKDKGLKFVEYDVGTDKAKWQEMVQKSGQTAVPVMEVNGRVLVGFNSKLIDAALAKQRAPKRDEVINNLFFDIINI
jgi:glutaredoxin-like YruB-family protein